MGRDIVVEFINCEDDFPDYHEYLRGCFLGDTSDEKIKNLQSRISDLENMIDRLRGQLQNCVNHLDRANRRDTRGNYSECIESANKALYETLCKNNN